MFSRRWLRLCYQPCCNDPLFCYFPSLCHPTSDNHIDEDHCLNATMNSCDSHIGIHDYRITTASTLHHVTANIASLYFWREARDLRCLPTLINHNDALEGDDSLAVLIVASSQYRHNANIRARARLPLLKHLRLRINSVTFENRIG